MPCDVAFADDGLGLQHHVVEAPGVHLLPDLDEVAIGAGHQAVEHLDDVDARAERRVHGRHLEADDAAADHEHPLRAWTASSSAPVESTTRGSSGMNGSLTACVPAAMIAFSNFTTFFAPDLLLPGAGGELDLEVMRIEEAADAAHDLDLARLGHAGEAAGQLADDLLLPAAQLVEVDLRRAERDAVRRASAFDFVHHGGDVQQRLRRNAADVEAHAAERRVALDEHRLHAEIGGAERGGVAAGAGAEHEHLAFDVGACRCSAARCAACSARRRGGAPSVAQEDCLTCAELAPSRRRGIRLLERGAA